MGARLQFRYIIIGGTTGIGTEVVREVAVQVVGLRHFAVDDEFQVMAYAVACGVDAVLVGDVGHEVGRTVHVAPVRKRRCVEITIDRRAYLVVLHGLRAVDVEAILRSVGCQGMVLIDRMDVHQSCSVLVVDVQRHGEGELKDSVLYVVGTVEKHLRAVVEPERRTGFTRIVEFAYDQLARITHRRRHLSLEGLLQCAVSFNVSFHLDHRAGLQLRHGCCIHSRSVGRPHRYAVDFIDNRLQSRQVQRHGWVAKQGVLQFVLAQVLPGRNHFVLRPSLCLAQGDGLSVVKRQHMLQESRVQILVLIGIHGAGGTIEGHGTATPVQQRHLTDGLAGRVEGHNVARSRHPQRQVGIDKPAEIRAVQHALVRDHVCTSVSGIVHNQCTSLLLLLYQSYHLRIAVARRRSLTGIGIPHHLLDHVAGIEV